MSSAVVSKMLAVPDSFASEYDNAKINAALGDTVRKADVVAKGPIALSPAYSLAIAMPKANLLVVSSSPFLLSFVLNPSLKVASERLRHHRAPFPWYLSRGFPIFQCPSHAASGAH